MLAASYPLCYYNYTGNGNGGKIMARPVKKVDVETVAWTAEYLVSRVNRADWKLHLNAPEKRNLDNGKDPKSEVYQLASLAIDLQRLPTFGQEAAWLDALRTLLERVNTWIDDYLDSQDRKRLWTAYRVSQGRGIDPSDELIFENYQMIMRDKQQELNL